MSRRIEVKNNNNGIGFFGLLTILLMGLKLTGYLNVSWFLVLAPILFPLVIILTILLIGGAVFLLEERNKTKKSKK